MAMLVLNAGSSSLKAAIVDGGSRSTAASDSRLRGACRESAAAGAGALEREAPAALAAVAAIGHRIVHGGPTLLQPVRVDDGVEAAIEAASAARAAAQSPGLAVLRVMRRTRPDLPQVAVFDTAFHATLPEAARRYALPLDLCERHGLRRFGFHGISHADVMRRCAQRLAQTPRRCASSAAISVPAVVSPRSIAVAASTPAWASRRSRGW